MSDAKQKWDEVGERFSALGREMRDRFDARQAFTEEDREKVNNALHQIGDALDAGFTALGDSVRDPSIRADVKQAGASVADALAATFKEIGDELRRAVTRD